MNHRLVSAVLSALLSFSCGSLSATEKFNGGEVKKAGFSAVFSSRGCIDAILIDGQKIMRTNNGVTTTGSKDNEWEPWMPQMYLKDVSLSKEDTPECTVVASSGILQPKGSSSSSKLNVIAKIYADKLVQECSIRTLDKDLWKRVGESFNLDSSVLGAINYRADGGEWKAIPETKGNRNLLWPESASILEVISEKYLLTFKFDGIKTYFFDDRKDVSPYINLELNIPPSEIKEEDGTSSYGGNFTVAVSFAQNKSGALPVKPKADPNAGSAIPASSFELSEKGRLVESSDFRKRYSLDGQWDLMPLGGTADFASDLFKYPVPAEKWRKTDVPMPRYIQDEWNGPQHAAWYRTQFTVPDDLKGRAIYLHFEEVSFDTRAYLNGKEIGKHFGGYIPLDFDATDSILLGKPNILEVFTGDATSAYHKNMYPQGAPKTGWAGRLEIKDSSLFALLFSSHKGIIQGVYLDAMPQSYISDVFVKTSVRKWKLDADVEVSNTGKEAKKFTVKSSICEGDKVVKELPAKEIEVAPSSLATATSSVDWKDPKLWGFKEPNLYFLKTELLQGGNVVDSIKTRFGFREFWLAGADFYLNGVKTKLRECATHIYFHPGWIDWDKRYAGKPYEGAKAEMESIQLANFNCTRMVHRPHPAFFYDIADEIGHLVISHFPAAFNYGQFDIKNPLLAKNAEVTVTGQVRKERNHPSIIMWEGENEGFPYGENEIARNYAEFYYKSIGQVAKKLDPTRTLKFGGDGDIFDKADIVDIHGGDLPDLGDTPLPNSNWLVLDRLEGRSHGPVGRVYGLLGGEKWIWKKNKPLYLGEGLYWMSSPDKGKAARFIGEKVYDDRQLGDHWYRGQENDFGAGLSEYFKVAIPIWRMMGVLSGYCPWGVASGFGVTLTMHDFPVFQVSREMMKPERFFLKQMYCNFFAGDKINYDFCFINEDKKSNDYTIEWSASVNGAKFADDNFRLKIDPAELKWKAVSFDAPMVDGKQDIILEVKMSRDGTAVHAEKIVLKAYPHRVVSAIGKKVCLFDPDGKTGKALSKIGVKFDEVSSVEDAIKAKPDIFIIGQFALSEGTDVPLALDEYVRIGGKVLVLSQKTGKAYSPASRPDATQSVTRENVFICDKNHPLVKDISDDELKYWNHPEWDLAHSVSLCAGQKFGRGNIHAVMDCDNMWFAPLQEFQYGKGLYVECSLDIVNKIGSEPVAEKIWTNILSRLANFATPEYKPLLVLRDEEIVKNFQKQGIVCYGTDKIPESGILMLTNNSKISADEKSILRSFAEKGNTLWFHLRKDADSSPVEAVTGSKIKVSPYPGDSRERAVRRTESGRISKTLSGINSVAIYERNSVDDIWTAEGGNSTELATGGAIIEFNAGNGNVIVERIAWDNPTNLLHQQWADHFLHSFVTNLGAEIDVYKYMKRKIYNPENFVQVDISQVCNRGFRDDVPDNGEGGWTDQGPGNDMRGMKTGKQTYHQIVFGIVDPLKNDGKSCLVMNSERYSADSPKKTSEISVNAKVDTLFFLHTAAWYGDAQRGKPVIKYFITYDDGTVAKVEAIGGDNIKDWWTPGNCEESRGVSLLLKSDTEADTVPRRRGLQLQEWENSNPEKTIGSIRIESANSGAIPIVMGISGYRK
ncbi:MAG: glycoside hydrolase family 2 TIM barrel-domain containing protein [Victivallales bacterium]